LAVDDDELVADQRLDARAREVLQAGCKEGVKAFAGGIYTNFHDWILSAENDAASFKFKYPDPALTTFDDLMIQLKNNLAQAIHN
jgi:hypothetical protein